MGQRFNSGRAFCYNASMNATLKIIKIVNSAGAVLP